MITKVQNGRIVMEDTVAEGLSLYWDGSIITHITSDELPCDTVIDARGAYIAPGFIDMHTHGGGGYDFMDGGAEPIVEAVRMHQRHGTTSILPTTLACSTGTLREFLQDLRVAMKQCEGILGAHLEGPYFSLEQCGAQNPEYIKAPDEQEYTALIAEFGDIIKRWDFAPELAGSSLFCETLLNRGIIPSIGHSNATLDEVKPVYEIGCRLLTHLYSGMSTITRKGGFRRLGVVESAYYYDDMAVEIIADGCHLPPDLLKLITQQKRRDLICLITDSMRGAGMPDGHSLLGRKAEAMPCIIEEGVAKLLDRSACAGSVATADRLIRTMVHEVGLSIPDAVRLMTKNPAQILGLKTKGELKPGYDADIVLFGDDIAVQKVFLMGREM